MQPSSCTAVHRPQIIGAQGWRENSEFTLSALWYLRIGLLGIVEVEAGA